MCVCVCVCVCVFGGGGVRYIKAMIQFSLWSYYYNVMYVACHQQMSVRFTSLHFKMVSMRSEKPILMCSTPSLRGFPNVAFETVPVFVRLTMALSRPFKEDRLVLPFSTPLSNRPLTDVM